MTILYYYEKRSCSIQKSAIYYYAICYDILCAIYIILYMRYRDPYYFYYYTYICYYEIYIHITCDICLLLLHADYSYLHMLWYTLLLLHAIIDLVTYYYYYYIYYFIITPTYYICYYYIYMIYIFHIYEHILYIPLWLFAVSCLFGYAVGPSYYFVILRHIRHCPPLLLRHYCFSPLRHYYCHYCHIITPLLRDAILPVAIYMNWPSAIYRHYAIIDISYWPLAYYILRHYATPLLSAITPLLRPHVLLSIHTTCHYWLQRH